MRGPQSHQVATVSAWLARLVGIGCQLAILPCWSRALSVDGFAALGALQVLQGWLMLADGGLANSLQNHLSEHHGARRTAVLLAGAALWSVVGAGALLLAWAAGAGAVRGWVLGDLALGPDHGGRALAIAGAAMVLTACAVPCYRVWLAEGRGWLAFALPALAQVLGLGATLALPAPQAGGGALADFAAAWYLPQALVPVVACAGLAVSRRVWTVGWRRSALGVRALLPRAGRFWLFAALAAAVLCIDIPVLTHVAPAKEIATFMIAKRVFELVFFVYSATLVARGPLWTRWLRSGGHDQVRGQCLRLIAWGCAIVVAGGVACAVARPLVLALLAPGLGLELPLALLALATLYYCVRAWTDTWAAALTAGSRLGPLLRALPFQGAATAALFALLVPAAGAEGIFIALAAAFAATVGWYLPRAFLRGARTAPPAPLPASPSAQLPAPLSATTPPP